MLYPPDVNNFPLTQVINYPTNDWTPANLNCLKTESFTYTYDRNLDMALVSMNSVNSLGFTPSQRSHLVGVSDPSTAWLKEVQTCRRRRIRIRRPVRARSNVSDWLIRCLSRAECAAARNSANASGARHVRGTVNVQS